MSAHGNKNIIRKVKEELKKHKVVVAIVDGAAFGGSIEALIQEKKNQAKYGKVLGIVAPESFEWMCLQSRIFNSKEPKRLKDTYNIEDILKHTEDFIQYDKNCRGWENFYTDLLNKSLVILSGKPYSKSKVNDEFRRVDFLEDIKNQLSMIKVGVKNVKSTIRV